MVRMTGAVGARRFYGTKQFQETIHRHRRCLRTRPGHCRHRPRARSGAPALTGASVDPSMRSFANALLVERVAAKGNEGKVARGYPERGQDAGIRRLGHPGPHAQTNIEAAYRMVTGKKIAAGWSTWDAFTLSVCASRASCRKFAAIFGNRRWPLETGLRGWAYRIRTGESVRELSDWNFVTTSPEVGASPAAETLRVRAARYGFAAPAEISADDLSAEKRTASRAPVGSGRVIGSAGRRHFALDFRRERSMNGGQGR